MRQRRAVIIDDEPDVTTYLGTILTDNGWAVKTANHADEGVALAREDPPDVVLLDIMMPDRGGLSTLVELRKDEKLGKIPIVIVSGIQETLTSNFRNFLSRFKYRQPDAFVDKPVDPKDLLQLLDKLTLAEGS